MIVRKLRDLAMATVAPLIALVMQAGSAYGQAALYHSPPNDGTIPAATPVLPSAGPEWLHLYADTAGNALTSTGTACEDGDGDEICGWHVSLEAGPGAELLAFTPAPGTHYSLTSTALSAAGVDAITPATAPVWVGDLQVQSTDPMSSSSIDATGVHVVTAGLRAEPVAHTSIATIPVPEPGVVIGLGSGIVLLGALRRSRRR